MLDFNALCPHCERKFKLSMIGLETNEFIQCPHFRRVNKLDLADSEKKAIRISPDFASQFMASKCNSLQGGQERRGCYDEDRGQV